MKKFIFTKTDGRKEVFCGKIVRWLEKYENGNGFAVVEIAGRNQTLALEVPRQEAAQ